MACKRLRDKKAAAVSGVARSLLGMDSGGLAWTFKHNKVAPN